MCAFLLGCNIFPKDERLLAEHTTSDGIRVRIYFVSLGATTNDNIQVKQSNSKSAIWISENYNYLKSSDLVGDTLLKLCLSDTGYSINNHRVDTVFVKVK
jgi:hypothetical protein